MEVRRWWILRGDSIATERSHGRATAAASVCDASIKSTAEGQRVSSVQKKRQATILLGVKKRQATILLGVKKRGRQRSSV
jgi:hypothetical protein